jgi:ABC-type multidrug transport system fused ATPase/permease subunit
VSIIQILYHRYRWPIILALSLVVLENVAYIAEPYVFGQAIDGLQEARLIEEEVDSSISSVTLRQYGDSVRAHVLDSLHTLDSLKRLDSLESDASPSDTPVSPAATFATIPKRVETHRSTGLFHSALFRTALFIPASPSQDIPVTDTLDEGEPPPPHSTPENLRRLLAKRDSLRSSARRKRSLIASNSEAARDSIRKHLHAHPPAPKKSALTRQSKPVSFFIPKSVAPFLPPLIPWVLLFMINSSLGAVRRLYDTRLYTRMFAKLSSEVVGRQLAQGEELSKVAARSSMSWHNIEFFQYNVPEFIEQLIAVGGAVIALGLFDWRLTVVGSILVVLVAFGSKYYMRTVQAIQVKLHDKYEDEYNVFGTRQPHNIRAYYDEIADLEIRLSKRSTVSYSIVRVFLLIMFLTMLYISIDLDRFTIGSLYSIIAYVWVFVTATEYIPYLSEKWVELKDASRRIVSIDEEEVEEE